MASSQVFNSHRENLPLRQTSMIEIEVSWENLTIVANMGKQKKVLINNLKGITRPFRVTAIMGPSGSGKTTLLNCLSGRLVSNNLEVYGKLRLNGEQISDIDAYSNKFAYVMQDVVLLATMSPRECFKFVANIRLKGLSEQQKQQKVEDVLYELGLQKCGDTQVGGSIIRGISGGERKRTSIGVELLTNPSLIFLDEPTTGLDSSTALQVLELLQKIAMKGVNVVCTIHQPSSEIFAIFDQLILLCRGNIIYQGTADKSVPFFQQIGFKCPDFSNPSDYFMKIMNEEGLQIEKMEQNLDLNISDLQLEQEFVERVNTFVTEYKNSEMVKAIESDQKLEKLKKNDQSFNVDGLTQFKLLLVRAFLNEIRNPMDVKMKFAQTILVGIFMILVFSNLGEHDLTGIQSRNGALFFIITALSIQGFTGALHAFTTEKIVYLRERSSQSYNVGPYFWAKSLAELPFQLIYPILFVCIMYHAIGLNGGTDRFFMSWFILTVTFWHGSSYGQFISTIVPSLEIGAAMTQILIVPFMMVGGLFVNANQIPIWLRWLQDLSIFKFGYQALAYNEYEGEVYFCKNSKGIDMPCDPLAQNDFPDTFWESILAGLVSGLIFKILAWIALYKIGNPRKAKVIDHQFNNPEIKSN